MVARGRKGDLWRGETPTPGLVLITLLKLIIIVTRYKKKVKIHNMEGPIGARLLASSSFGFSYLPVR